MRSASAARPVRSIYNKQPPLSPNLTSTLPATFKTPFRCLAAEPGFPDRGNVSSRVLEVVRKFEKVRANFDPVF